jgi:hypothetical protein
MRLLPLELTTTARKRPLLERLLQALNGRSSRFALMFPRSPQNSCRFGLIYYQGDTSKAKVLFSSTLLVF